MANKITGQASKVYSNLDPRVRLGVQLVGFGLAVFILYRIITKINEAPIKKPYKEEEQATADDLQVLNQNSATKQKITNSQAQAFANKIFACMNGKGTYDADLIAVFHHLHNDADFLAVEKAYGTRTLLSGFFLTTDFTGTMVASIVSDADSSSIVTINKILAKKGIKRRI